MPEDTSPPPPAFHMLFGEHVRCTPTLDQLFAALSSLQGELSTVMADSTGQIGGKKTVARHYRYLSLAGLLEALNPLLGKNKLSFSQYPIGNSIICWLGHADGQWIATRFVSTILGGSNEGISDAQAYGSALTYLRRYSMMSIFGLAAEDDDGHSAGSQSPPSPPPSPPPSHAPPSVAAAAAEPIVATLGSSAPPADHRWISTLGSADDHTTVWWWGVEARGKIKSGSSMWEAIATTGERFTVFSATHAATIADCISARLGCTIAWTRREWAGGTSFSLRTMRPLREGEPAPITSTDLVVTEKDLLATGDLAILVTPKGRFAIDLKIAPEIGEAIRVLFTTTIRGRIITEIMDPTKENIHAHAHDDPPNHEQHDGGVGPAGGTDEPAAQ